MKDRRTFGFDPKKEKKLIGLCRRWYVCSFCGRIGEVRPHSPVLEPFPSVFPMRLCYECATIQENIHKIRKNQEAL